MDLSSLEEWGVKTLELTLLGEPGETLAQRLSDKSVRVCDNGNQLLKRCQQSPDVSRLLLADVAYWQLWATARTLNHAGAIEDDDDNHIERIVFYQLAEQLGLSLCPYETCPTMCLSSTGAGVEPVRYRAAHPFLAESPEYGWVGKAMFLSDGVTELRAEFCCATEKLSNAEKLLFVVNENHWSRAS